MEMLETKNISEIKTYFNEFISRLDTAEKGIREIENSQTIHFQEISETLHSRYLTHIYTHTYTHTHTHTHLGYI